MRRFITKLMNSSRRLQTTTLANRFLTFRQAAISRSAYQFRSPQNILPPVKYSGLPLATLPPPNINNKVINSDFLTHNRTFSDLAKHGGKPDIIWLIILVIISIPSSLAYCSINYLSPGEEPSFEEKEEPISKTMGN